MAKDAVFSMRLSAEEAQRLREYADEQGRPASDLVREAIVRMTRKPIGWQCDHFDITAPPGVLVSVNGPGCCELRPVFEPAELLRREASC